jgi:hypothetical protein
MSTTANHTGYGAGAATPAGSDLVVLAGWLADELPTLEGDDERFALLDACGYPVAPVAEHLGGLGVRSLHDLVLATGRLAQADRRLALIMNDAWAAALEPERRAVARALLDGAVAERPEAGEEQR